MNQTKTTWQASSEANQLAEYQSISIAAIASLLLGAASLLSFISPLLIAVPIVGVVFSVVTMRRIEKSEGQLLGKRLALIGFALAMLFGVSSKAKTFVSAKLLEQQSQTCVASWVQLLQEEKFEAAMSLTTLTSAPAPHSHLPSHDHDEDHDEENKVDKFKQHKVVSQLIALGTDATPKATGKFSYEKRNKGVIRASQQYVLPGDGGKLANFIFSRSPAVQDGSYIWRIERCDFSD